MAFSTIPYSNTFANPPMDTLRALEAFVHSVELGSLSGAARALDTTQPTVSKLVAGLERSLGCGCCGAPRPA
jgi:hypothetical protein